jgi:outer membrane protein TolC
VKLKTVIKIVAIAFGILNLLNVQAETIDFENTMQKALDNSFELKASTINIDISKSKIDSTRSEYFPLVKSGLYSEYSQDMSANNQTEAVGNTVITPNTKIQSMLNTSVTYNIFDFGQRKRKMLMAKDDIEAKQSIYLIKRRDLKLNIIDLYSNVLIDFKELMAKEQIHSITSEIAVIKEKKYNEGTVTKLDKINSAIETAKLTNEIEDLRIKLAYSLRNLSYYTNEEYNADEVVVSGFEDRKNIPVQDTTPTLKDNNTIQIEVKKQESIKPEEITLNLQFTPDYKSYQAKLDKKDKEIELLDRNKLPKFGMYMNYTLMGKDENNILESLQNFQNKNAAIGLSTTFVPFDGYKSAADKKRLKLEMKKIKLERDQAMADLKNKYEKLNEEMIYYQRTSANSKYLLTLLADKLTELKAIAKTQPDNCEDILNEQIKIISQQLELEKKLINKDAAVKKYQIFSQGIE